MKIKEYFKNLPQKWSANFLATLGATCFLHSIIGMFIIIYDLRFYPHTTFADVIAKIPDAFKMFLYIKTFLFAFSCKIALIPLFVHFVLMFYRIRAGAQLLILLAVIFQQALPWSYIPDHGYGMFYAAMLMFHIPALIAVILIFLVLLIFDSNPKTAIKVKSVSENIFYRAFVYIFFVYSILIFLTSTTSVINLLKKFQI